MSQIPEQQYKTQGGVSSVFITLKKTIIIHKKTSCFMKVFKRKTNEFIHIFNKIIF